MLSDCAYLSLSQFRLFCVPSLSLACSDLYNTSAELLTTITHSTREKLFVSCLYIFSCFVSATFNLQTQANQQNAFFFLEDFIIHFLGLNKRTGPGLW
jgi:hypothetical protein